MRAVMLLAGIIVMFIGMWSFPLIPEGCRILVHNPIVGGGLFGIGLVLTVMPLSVRRTDD